MQKNEAELCKIVVKIFEKQLHVRRGLVTKPEKDGSGPPVEIRVELGKVRVALEHTVIESFDNAIKTGHEFKTIQDKLLSELDGELPVPGIYHLEFPVHPTAGCPSAHTKR